MHSVESGPAITVPERSPAVREGGAAAPSFTLIRAPRAQNTFIRDPAWLDHRCAWSGEEWAEPICCCNAANQRSPSMKYNGQRSRWMPEHPPCTLLFALCGQPSDCFVCDSSEPTRFIASDCALHMYRLSPARNANHCALPRPSALVASLLPPRTPPAVDTQTSSKIISDPAFITGPARLDLRSACSGEGWADHICYCDAATNARHV